MSWSADLLRKKKQSDADFASLAKQALHLVAGGNPVANVHSFATGLPGGYNQAARNDILPGVTKGSFPLLMPSNNAQHVSSSRNQPRQQAAFALPNLLSAIAASKRHLPRDTGVTSSIALPPAPPKPLTRGINLGSVHGQNNLLKNILVNQVVQNALGNAAGALGSLKSILAAPVQQHKTQISYNVDGKSAVLPNHHDLGHQRQQQPPQVQYQFAPMLPASQVSKHGSGHTNEGFKGESSDSHRKDKPGKIVLHHQKVSAEISIPQDPNSLAGADSPRLKQKSNSEVYRHPELPQKDSQKPRTSKKRVYKAHHYEQRGQLKLSDGGEMEMRIQPVLSYNEPRNKGDGDQSGPWPFTPRKFCPECMLNRQEDMYQTTGRMVAFAVTQHSPPAQYMSYDSKGSEEVQPKKYGVSHKSKHAGQSKVLQDVVRSKYPGSSHSKQGSEPGELSKGPGKPTALWLEHVESGLPPSPPNHHYVVIFNEPVPMEAAGGDNKDAMFHLKTPQARVVLLPDSQAGEFLSQERGRYNKPHSGQYHPRVDTIELSKAIQTAAAKTNEYYTQMRKEWRREMTTWARQFEAKLTAMLASSTTEFHTSTALTRKASHTTTSLQSSSVLLADNPAGHHGPDEVYEDPHVEISTSAALMTSRKSYTNKKAKKNKSESRKHPSTQIPLSSNTEDSVPREVPGITRSGSVQHSSSEAPTASKDRMAQQSPHEGLGMGLYDNGVHSVGRMQQPQHKPTQQAEKQASEASKSQPVSKAAAHVGSEITTGHAHLVTDASLQASIHQAPETLLSQQAKQAALTQGLVSRSAQHPPPPLEQPLGQVGAVVTAKTAIANTARDQMQFIDTVNKNVVSTYPQLPEAGTDHPTLLSDTVPSAVSPLMPLLPGIQDQVPAGSMNSDLALNMPKDAFHNPQLATVRDSSSVGNQSSGMIESGNTMKEVGSADLQTDVPALPPVDHYLSQSDPSIPTISYPALADMTGVTTGIENTVQPVFDMNSQPASDSSQNFAPSVEQSADSGNADSQGTIAPTT
jgi:hypothetical protein